MTSHKSVLPAIAIAMAVTGSAHAGFRVEAPEYRPSVHPGDRQAHVGVPDDYRLVGNKRIRYIEITGIAPEHSVSGFGGAIPLDAAVELIMPDRWLAYSNPEVDGDALVSWDSDQSWLDVLRGIAIRKQLRFFIDANKQVLRVEKMTPDSALIRLAKYDPDTGRLLGSSGVDADASEASEIRAGGDDGLDQTATSGTRGDEFGPEDGALSDGGGAGFRNEVRTDEFGMPVTYVYGAESSDSSSSSMSDSSADPRSARDVADKPTPVDASPYPVSPGKKEAEAIRARLAEQGLVAEAGESLPWFYRELPDGTRIRQIAGGRHPGSSLTLTEYYAELIVLNIHDAPIEDALREISPAGWDIDMAVPDGYVDGKVISRLVTESPRGEVISQLQKKLGIAITPYPIQNLIVVTAK